MAVRAAGFVIFRRNPQIEYLLMQTSYGKHHWSPPKGHVDKGESDYTTALRETEEESGLVEENLKIYTDFKSTLEYMVNDKPKVVTYWLAELINANTPIQLSSEHIAFKWLALEEACALAGYDDFSKLLKSCQDFITGS